LFTDSVLIISFPVVRAAVTISAKPKLASQAPRASRIRHDTATGIMFIVKVRGIISTKLKVTPSKDNRDINKWFCCKMKVKNIIKGISWVNINTDSIRPGAVNLSLTYKVIASY
jgi:hypothetical protein